MSETAVELAESRVRLTNLDRVLWPETGFTKGDMVDYYSAVAGVLLPHLRDRPITLARFPMGVHDKGWYQTNCRGAPDWMRTAEVVGRRGASFHMCLIDDRDSLLWVVNQGTIELHPLLSTVDAPERPQELVFDLDPGPPAGIVECCRVALRLREVLVGEHLVGWPKTSGSLGLHVYAPLDRQSTFASTRAYARSLAERLAAEAPELVTATIQGPERAGRVLIDWRQNEPMRSMVAPYSLRATPWPLASTPLRWEEVDQAAARRDGRSLMFGPAEVVDRLRHTGELFAPVLTARQGLPLDRPLARRPRTV